MHTTNKGFTLIELLITIAIIGILASIILTSISSARSKAQTVAFKAEIKSASKSLISACQDGDLDNTTPGIAATLKHSVGNIIDQNCGYSGLGIFNVTYLADPSPQGTCTGANVNEQDIIFLGC